MQEREASKCTTYHLPRPENKIKPAEFDHERIFKLDSTKPTWMEVKY